MSPELKRLLFPLRGPRIQTQAFLPLAVLAAAVDGFHEAFFAVLNPKGKS